jgi:tripartite motif-containing protein 71
VALGLAVGSFLPFGVPVASGSPLRAVDVAAVPRHVGTVGGGPRGHAEMYPSGVDVDGLGNVFVADTGDDQVQRYDSSGNLVWERGGRGPKAPGRFFNPRDVAVLGPSVFVADTGYNRVQVLRKGDGSVASVWPRRFGTIMGISAGVDGEGRPIILVSEASTNTILVFSPSGVLLRSIGSGPGDAVGQLNGVRDAATDAAGTIYAADYANSRVVTFGPLGLPRGTWGVNGTGPGQLKRPYGIDVDVAGHVYVADSNNRIHRFTAGGRFLSAYGAPGTGRGRFQMLRRVAVGRGTSPRVYGADLWTYKVEVFRHGGAHVRRLGGDRPDLGFFNEPSGVAVTRQHLFVMDTVNQRVQRFSSKGPSFGFQLAWGARGWGEGSPGFNWARDVTVGSFDGSLRVWVADTRNSRLTEFSTGGTPTGRRLGRVGSAIGELNWPNAVDAALGDLYVADTKNDRVQRWDPADGAVRWSVASAGGEPIAGPTDCSVAAGEVYVAEVGNRRIVVLSAATGAFLRRFGGNVLHRPEGVAVEPGGDVWVADTSWDRLVEFSPDGTVKQIVRTWGPRDRPFNKPMHLEVLRRTAGVFLFVTDSWRDRVLIFDIG